MSYEDIIVVEGNHDVIKIKKAYPNANCCITNGSEISIETIRYLKEMSKLHRIIIFTDPDSPGEKIRSEILKEIPNALNAFIRKKDSISKNNKKVGVEHASVLDIKKALDGIYNSEITINKSNIKLSDLYDLGLIGDVNSSIIRDKISDMLNIGRPNSKQFLKRINSLGLELDKLKELKEEVK